MNEKFALTVSSKVRIETHYEFKKFKVKKVPLNETVHLGVLEEGEILCLAKEESSQTIRMISYVGKRAPLHCTSLRKVLLAYLSAEERKKILGEKVLPRLTENTINDKKELEKELGKVREQDFALDREENEKDVRCVAAPIRNY